jgi:hypothetical protein
MAEIVETGADSPEVARTEHVLAAPRMAAVAGIAFAVLLTVALLLIRSGLPLHPEAANNALSTGGSRNKVLFGLSLVPFAGITFLWFVGVVRDRFGAHGEDKFLATVFMGSGILFVGMLFVAAAVTAGLVSSETAHGSPLVKDGVWGFSVSMTHTVLVIYGMRMAGVFMISTSTLFLRNHAVPKWLAFLGYAIALTLLIAIGFYTWAELLFPLWVAALSIYILVDRKDFPAMGAN